MEVHYKRSKENEERKLEESRKKEKEAKDHEDFLEDLLTIPEKWRYVAVLCC